MIDGGGGGGGGGDGSGARANVTATTSATCQRRNGRVVCSVHGRQVTIAVLVIALIALPVLVIIMYMTLWFVLPRQVAAVEQDDGPASTGIKDAIQDLYAEIKASESDGSGGLAADSLDVATSAKAQYVADCLRRMIGGRDGSTTVGGVSSGGGSGGGAGGDHHHVRGGGRLADRRVTATVAECQDRTRTDAKPRNGDPPPPLSHEDVNELVQRFFDVLDHFDRLKSSSSATTIVAEPQRGTRGPAPSAIRRRSGRGVSATRSAPGAGLFKLAIFNRHRVSSPAAR